MIKVKVSLKTNNEEKIDIYNAIKTVNRIIYQEDCKVTILMDDKKMIREDNEYLLELDFNKGIITCFMKSIGKKYIIDMIIKNILIKEDIIIIEYEIDSTNQIISFKLEVFND